MPFNLLFVWLAGLLSLALFGGGVYLVWGWYEERLIGDRYLWTGTALIALTFLGGPLVRLLLPLRRGEDEPEATHAPRAQRIARPDGTEIHMEAYGPPDAPVIVLTHGWGLNSAEWYYAKRHLTERFRLIVWDLPGLGRSRHPQNKDYRLEKMARDLEAVVQQTGDQPVVLLGHSIGGMITLTFCRLFPEQLGRKVAGLILTHTTYTNPVETSKGAPLLRVLQKPLLEPLCHLMIVLSPLVRLMNWLSYLNGTMHLNTHFTHFGGSETRGQLDFVTRFSLQASPSVTARGMLAMLRWDATDTLPTITIPTLVVAANRDKATLPEASQRIHEAMPNAQILDLVPAGHVGLIEQNEQWSEAVGTFSTACLGAHRAAGA